MLLADICAQFVNVAPPELDPKIERAQRRICEALGVNHSPVWQLSENNPELLVMTHAYRDPQLRPLPMHPILNDYFPWASDKLLKKEVLSFRNTAEVPSAAAQDRNSWLEYGVRSTLAFPLSVGGGPVIGVLAFDSTEERDWPEALKRRLQIVALVFAQALECKNAELKMKTAEDALRASEERLRLAQQAARIGTFEWNMGTGVNTWTTELEAIYGLPPGGFGGTQTHFEKLVHPDDRAEVIQLVEFSVKTGRPTHGEWRIVWADGNVHWIVGRWQVFRNPSGKPLRMIGVNLDITERKLAEEALAEMTGKLVEAQEQERARIAGELHDDINQRLAMLAVELEQLQDTAPEVRSRLQELRDQASEISYDVQAMSHDLHSAKLEYVGVVAGIDSWCREFAERQKMHVDFQSDAPSVLPLEVGISLFRILREALHNVIKHSGVRRVEVRLREHFGEIHLTTKDSGKGFNVESAMKNKGLGLISMRERVRLVSGTMMIDSKMMGGTAIHVRVPLVSGDASKRQAV